MIKVETCATVAEAAAYGPVGERLPAAGASEIFTSPAWCLAAWTFLPDLGRPHLLVATTDDGPLGFLPLTAGPSGLSWAGSPLGDEHDARLRPGPASPRTAARLVQEIICHSPSADALLTEVRPTGALVDVADSRPGASAPILRLREPDPVSGALACIPGWSRSRLRELRRLRRGCERLGKLTVTRLTDPAQLQETISDFVAARLAAWKAHGRYDELPVMDRHPGSRTSSPP